MLRPFVCLIALALGAASLWGEDPVISYTNPIAVPRAWADYGVGDPFLYRWNGTYYLYISTKDGQRGIEAFTSADLVHWAPAGLVVDDEASVGAYAPEVTYWNGWFTLCTSPAGHGHYFYRARSPLGPFERFTDNLGQTIDGSFFRDDDGQGYFLRASPQGIVGLKWDGAGGLGDETLLKGTWLGHWTEGPFLVRHGGHWFLTLTGNHVLSDGYRVNYAVSDQGPLGPYEMPADNPLLISTAAGFKGLGHSSSVLGPDLQSWWIAYHQFDGFSSAGLPMRSLNIDRLVFHDRTLGVAGPSHQPMPAPAAPSRVMAFGSPPAAETFDAEPTGPDWTAEWTFLAGASGRSGIVFGSTGPGTGTRVWLDPKALFAGFDPRDPHVVRAEAEGGRVTVWVDGYRLTPVTAPTDGRLGVVQEGSGLKVGYAAFTRGRPSAADEAVRMPIPGRLPPGRAWDVAVAEPGTYEVPLLGKVTLAAGWQRLTLPADGPPATNPILVTRFEPVPAQNLRTPPWLLLNRGRYWVGDPRWHDYRVAVTLAGADRSSAPAGLMVRTTQESNYRDQVAEGFLGYEVEVTGAQVSFLRVRYDQKRVLGTLTLPGAPASLPIRVEAVGARLKVFLADQPTPAFDVDDDDPMPAGRVGVYSADARLSFRDWSIEPWGDSK